MGEYFIQLTMISAGVTGMFIMTSVIMSTLMRIAVALENLQVQSVPVITATYGTAGRAENEQDDTDNKE